MSYSGSQSVRRFLLAVVLAAGMVGVLIASAPSNGVKVLGATVVAIETANAEQVGIDTRNGRVWMKTTTSEILARGATKLASRPCVAALGIPKIGVLVGAACVSTVARTIDGLARRHPGRGIWVEIGRCSSGRTGVCSGLY